MTFFHNFAHNSGQTDWIFMKTLPQMYLWTRKSPLNFGSLPDPQSISRVLIRIETPDMDSGSGPDSPWQRYAVSDCSCWCCLFIPVAVKHLQLIIFACFALIWVSQPTVTTQFVQYIGFSLGFLDGRRWRCCKFIAFLLLSFVCLPFLFS